MASGGSADADAGLTPAQLALVEGLTATQLGHLLTELYKRYKDFGGGVYCGIHCVKVGGCDILLARDADVVLRCYTCGVGIVRNSEEHDNIIITGDDKIICQDCPDPRPDSEK